MGREIRMVVPHWEHPKKLYARLGKLEEDYIPLHDRDFETAMKDYLDELQEWLTSGFAKCRAENPELNYDPAQPYRSFTTWNCCPPDPDYYRPMWKEAEMTWYQMYETVSEGTPVTPPFSTKEELVDYLVKHGDFSDQKLGNGGWKRENAESFVRAGWAPSMMMSRTSSGVEIKQPRDGIV